MAAGSTGGAGSGPYDCPGSRAAGGADVPHGLWLPLSAEDPRAAPALDGRTVEVVDRAGEREVLDGLFVKDLRAVPVRP